VPRKPPTPAKAPRKKPTNITLSDAMKDRLQRYCNGKGMSLSVFIAIACDEKFKREKFS
jgi:hypothetical protein